MAGDVTFSGMLKRMLFWPDDLPEANPTCVNVS
jgi:hypothetical protein